MRRVIATRLARNLAVGDLLLEVVVVAVVVVIGLAAAVLLYGSLLSGPRLLAPTASSSSAAASEPSQVGEGEDGIVAAGLAGNGGPVSLAIGASV